MMFTVFTYDASDGVTLRPDLSWEECVRDTLKRWALSGITVLRCRATLETDSDFEAATFDDLMEQVAHVRRLLDLVVVYLDVSQFEHARAGVPTESLVGRSSVWLGASLPVYDEGGSVRVMVHTALPQKVPAEGLATVLAEPLHEWLSAHPAPPAAPKQSEDAVFETSTASAPLENHEAMPPGGRIALSAITGGLAGAAILGTYLAPAHVITPVLWSALVAVAVAILVWKYGLTR